MNAVAALPDVRQHILGVAHLLFLQKGFTAVGLSELLATAQVPKGSFYHYFASKEAFGEAVLEAYFDEYLGRMDGLFSTPTPAAQRLMAFFDDWLESQIGDEAQSRCLVVKLGAEVSDLSESMRAALARGTQGVIDRLARCIEEGRADGSVPPAGETPAAQAAGLYQGWLGASLLAKISRSHAPLNAVMASTQRSLGLAPAA